MSSELKKKRKEKKRKEEEKKGQRAVEVRSLCRATGSPQKVLKGIG